MTKRRFPPPLLLRQRTLMDLRSLENSSRARRWYWLSQYELYWLHATKGSSDRTISEEPHGIKHEQARHYCQDGR